MKRDYELIKQILAAVEEKDIGESDLFEREDLLLTGVSENVFNYNAGLMLDAGLIKAYREEADNKTRIYVSSLTNAGHDFLDAARAPKVWEKFTKRLAEAGGSMAFDVAKELLIQLAKTALAGGS